MRLPESTTLRASDLDRVPHGAPTHFNDILRKVADDQRALFVDVDRALEEESGPALVGDDLFTDFAHPNLRAHQRIAGETRALRDAALPVPAEEWLWDLYTDPEPESLYREEPLLRTRELESRVFVCLVALRANCAEQARALETLEPGNQVARAVLGQVGK